VLALRAGANGSWHRASVVAHFASGEAISNATLRRFSLMTTAIIGTGGIGSAIARQIASGGQTLRLSSADTASARTLATQIGQAAEVAVNNRDPLQGADAVVLALRFTVLRGVIDAIADPLDNKLVVVPSDPSAPIHKETWYTSCPAGNPLDRW
jgi:predicted dinucleotide-binding enzyme